MKIVNVECKITSPPARGRGLKRCTIPEPPAGLSAVAAVAPRAGARIETLNLSAHRVLVASRRVAPRAGARIETLGQSPPGGGAD